MTLSESAFTVFYIFKLTNLYFSDIKPENFMLKNKGDTTCIKLIDFGLSKDYRGQEVMSTPSGSVSQLNL